MLPDLKNLQEASKAIKEQRVARGWTRPILASKLGISPRQLESYESFGKKGFTAPRPVTYNHLNKIFYGSDLQGQSSTQPLSEVTTEELINELKSRKVTVFQYWRG